ncbi:MAG TPA: hypothetical protein VLM79_04600 [Kofleriaceae bacterium]|nr:hypothetical protein [Kofleriaceae bacterium]
MRWCGLLLMAACAADPSLAITVRHPEGYGVALTLVTVYAGNDVRCDQIQYGDLAAAELAAIAIDEVEVGSGERLEISRLGGKSLVARGYDAQHRFVTAGCKDVGEIAGSAKVQIETQPAAVVAIDPGQAERPFRVRNILVNMTDVNGKPLEGMVSWQLTGPAGSPDQPPAEGVATQRGDAKIQVDDLGMPGPEGLRIRVPWAIAPLPLVTAFDLSGAMTVALPGGTLGGHPSCDVRHHAGKLSTLVCLGPGSATQHRDVVELAWQPQSQSYAATQIALPATIDNQFALFVDRDPAAADEVVYVISADAAGTGNWYKLGAPGGGKSMVFGAAVQNVIYIPRCHENSAGALIGVETGPAIADALDKTTFFTANGTQAIAPVDGEILSGGCVSDVDGSEHQAVVVAGPGDTAAALVLVTAANQMQPIPGTRLAGSGFVSVEDHGMAEKRFAGTRLQASGTVVFEAVLAPDAGGTFKLVERTELDAAAPPTKIVGGKLDQDDDTDLMWDVNIGVRRAHIVQVSLAKREHVSDEPLTAMTSGEPSASASNAAATDFLVGDLDGQLTDEMIVFSAGAVTIYSAD